MSLKITSDEIEIQNAAGERKFASGDSLLFERGKTTGTATVPADKLAVTVPHGLVYYPNFGDVAVLRYRIIDNPSYPVTVPMLYTWLPGHAEVVIGTKRGGAVIGSGDIQPIIGSAYTSGNVVCFTAAEVRRGDWVRVYPMLEGRWRDTIFPPGFAVNYEYDLTVYGRTMS